MGSMFCSMILKIPTESADLDANCKTSGLFVLATVSSGHCAFFGISRAFADPQPWLCFFLQQNSVLRKILLKDTFLGEVR